MIDAQPAALLATRRRKLGLTMCGAFSPIGLIFRARGIGILPYRYARVREGKIFIWWRPGGDRDGKKKNRPEGRLSKGQYDQPLNLVAGVGFEPTTFRL